MTMFEANCYIESYFEKQKDLLMPLEVIANLCGNNGMRTLKNKIEFFKRENKVDSETEIFKSSFFHMKEELKSKKVN